MNFCEYFQSQLQKYWKTSLQVHEIEVLYNCKDTIFTNVLVTDIQYTK